MNVKILAGIFTAFLSAFSAAAQVPYTDLSAPALRTAVAYLYDGQYLPFVQGTLFHPEEPLTRGDLAQLLCQVANLPVTEGGSGEQAMAQVAQAGIMQDGGNGFRPDESVTREELAGILARYLAYERLAEADGQAPPYADEKEIGPSFLPAVQLLHNKGIMVPADGFFNPNKTVTRGEGAEIFFRLLKNDGTYISHVQTEKEAIQAICAVYGSLPNYYRYGTLYWDDDTLVLGLAGKQQGRYVKAYLQAAVSHPGATVVRSATLSHDDYLQLMTRAEKLAASQIAAGDYVGVMPDYRAEQIVVMTRQPMEQSFVEALQKEIGTTAVRVEDLRHPTSLHRQVAAQPLLQKGNINAVSAVETAGRKDDVPLYSPLLDRAASKAIYIYEKKLIE
ncbi:S-layer homology domain-containing protein [Megasphaera vaginalis (ex Srinivasan et al. 2021)]|uniref:SLH domain protein n=1 Tax=Megasphaera vaginalis (ex Srinivasan et al. 2021) TaxID=1111454 RepID=U7UFY9_9FIRM|nr:S-layer homology domain-containing protein [Megasphaera vaginalis (ex Srinivasan et al. 2021)]ERT57789.1 SLH domain protein [Megasphaera vaginalis (ex Srinivasan et al. 2021)]